jgi:hypothetical protein
MIMNLFKDLSLENQGGRKDLFPEIVPKKSFTPHSEGPFPSRRPLNVVVTQLDLTKSYSEFCLFGVHR